jgi:hypothetical protein
MRHNGFEIKVSDLLNGKITDTLSFENQRLSEIENLTPEGVSGSLTLQSLDHKSLLVTLNQLKCSLEDSCDHCGKTFIRELEIENYVAKYVTEIESEFQDKEQDVLLIDMKNGVIDLEEMLYHAIQLEEPFVKRCSVCERLPVVEDEER